MESSGAPEHNLSSIVQTEQRVQPAPKSGWLRGHPYTAVLAGTGMLVVAGILIIRLSAPVQSSSQPLAWGGTGTLVGSTYGSEGSIPPSILQQTVGGPPYTYTLPNLQVSTTPDATPASGFDFDAFISMLSAHPQQNPPSSSGSASNAYLFIPTGLVSVTTPAKRTPLQNTLYEYGNEVGSLIQSFETEHPNATQVLADQAQDRADSGKAARLHALADGLKTLGDTLAQLDNVPSQASSAHQALAGSYQALGAKLTLVPSAERDADFLAAIQTYDTAVEKFTKNYVALANLFVAYGVSFSPADAGSVFTFTNTSGL